MIISKKISSFKVKEKSLFVFSLFILKELFYKSLLIIQCTLSNKIKAITLIDIYDTRFGFVAKEFAKIVCKKLEIQLQHLTKLKSI